MACFSDLTLSYTKSHSKIFGSFAIAFNKDKFIDYGANPVFYATPKHYEKIRSQIGLLEKMEELEKDRKWKQDLESYHFSEEETYSLQIVTGLLQEYAYKKDKRRLNYSQNEWRISFKSLPFANDDKNYLPGTATIKRINNKEMRVMKFSRDDIEFIVIPKSFENKGKIFSKLISKPYKVV